ncbi:MAG: AMP-dependent synthetase and ligase [Edaphobacter sp.]|nr:AMP-dependent synthetase and ligase [Edaphobacter sp.]
MMNPGMQDASTQKETGAQMDAASFRKQLEEHLSQSSERVLLRIVDAQGHPEELTGTQIVERSYALAEAHVGSAVPGSVVLLLLPHSVELFLLHIGLVLTGYVPAILAWPTSRVDAEKYQRNLLHQLRNLPAERLITIAALTKNLSHTLPYPAVACVVAGAARWEEIFTNKVNLENGERLVSDAVPLPAESGALFLQFSGGTTGAQKAVVITAAILSAQLERLAETLEFTEKDSVVSWLPMYHDMGLIACLWLPLWRSAQSLHFAASDWLLNPGVLFDYIERYCGTFTWLPNFAFSYLAAQHERVGQPRALGSMRAWINCSEPVRNRSMQDFAERYGTWGVPRHALQACYAMAENVFAVTQTRLGENAPVYSRSALRGPDADEASAERQFDLGDEVYVGSGRPLRDMEIRILAPGSGEPCAERIPGEIHLRTPSLFQGYWGSGGLRTSSFSSDGWYNTGDYGFLDGGELFVIGRYKDVIIVAGQNVFPEDVELAVNTVDGIYPGRVVAFGVVNEQQQTESVIVIAELRGEFDPIRKRSTERAIYQTVLTSIGIAPRQVAVVPERWIVKSTAGKISRTETRARFMAELFKQVSSSPAQRSAVLQEK